MSWIHHGTQWEKTCQECWNTFPYHETPTQTNNRTTSNKVENKPNRNQVTERIFQLHPLCHTPLNTKTQKSEWEGTFQKSPSSTYTENSGKTQSPVFFTVQEKQWNYWWESLGNNVLWWCPLCRARAGHPDNLSSHHRSICELSVTEQEKDRLPSFPSSSFICSFHTVAELYIL